MLKKELYYELCIYTTVVYNSSANLRIYICNFMQTKFTVIASNLGNVLHSNTSLLAVKISLNREMLVNFLGFLVFRFDGKEGFAVFFRGLASSINILPVQFF